MPAPFELSIVTPLTAGIPQPQEHGQLRDFLRSLVSRLSQRGPVAIDGSQRVVEIFGSADYALAKIDEYLSGEDGPVLAIWAAEELRRELARFEGVLVARGLGQTIFQSFSGLLGQVEQSLSQMIGYLRGRRSPLARTEDARAVLERLGAQFHELRALSSDIDYAYASRWRAPSKIPA